MSVSPPARQTSVPDLRSSSRPLSAGARLAHRIGDGQDREQQNGELDNEGASIQSDHQSLPQRCCEGLGVGMLRSAFTKAAGSARMRTSIARSSDSRSSNASSSRPSIEKNDRLAARMIAAVSG